MTKNLLLWSLIAVTLLVVYNNISKPAVGEAMNYSQFVAEINSGNITSVVFDSDGFSIYGERRDGTKFETVRPAYVPDNQLMDDLFEHDVRVEAKRPDEQSVWTQLFIAGFPVLMILAALVFFMRQMQGGAGGRSGPLSFGRSKAKLLEGGKVKTSFADVAGVEEAKEEVRELVDFLRDPSKFQKLGGRIPRGVLMVGSPGTGKTLLARAIAGEAKVPFFTISGSDFVEMFVGVGASRVRDMFDQAKRQAPCIIFIDEIDAVGRHRGAGLGGGHDEREQTLNQLLVEMDGFEGNDGIIVIAATNRPDVLDPALLRPGRFDRQVVVPLPDIRGREQILKVHVHKIPLEEAVDMRVVARGTPGFSGADLANLVNEAALLAARAGKGKVSAEELELAKDKIMMGAARHSMVMSEEQKLLTAYHESGHAIVGRLMPDHDEVYKVTIIPRGRALGVTMFLPEEDQYTHSRENILSKICSLYGGRIAEQLVMGEEKVTTGASNDIQVATDLARNMVTKWGLSEELGPLCYDEQESEIFLGRSAALPNKSLSNEVAKRIDMEVRRIVDECYERAKGLLTDNLDKLHAMAKALMRFETLDSSQIDDIMVGLEPRPPGDKSNGRSGDTDKPGSPIGAPASEH